MVLSDIVVFCTKLINMANKAIVCEQSFNVSAKRLWQAITNVNEMRQWYFENIPDFRAEKGFETQFMVDAGERQFMHLWKIIEVEKERLIKYDWRYQGYEGTGFVSFELIENAEATILKLTNEGLENFKPKVPEFNRESCIGGWNYFIKDRLKAYLEADK